VGAGWPREAKTALLSSGD